MAKPSKKPAAPATKPEAEETPAAGHVPAVATAETETRPDLAAGEGTPVVARSMQEKSPAKVETLAAGDVQPSAEPPPAAATVDAVTPGEPTIDQVLRDLVDAPPGRGYHQLSPEPMLSGEEAALQAQIYTVLARRGLSLRDQGGVYPWLLRQVARSLAD